MSRRINLNLENVNVTFEGLNYDKKKINRISKMAFDILDKKIEEKRNELNIDGEVNLAELLIPSVLVSNMMTDGEIAERIATEIFVKLRQQL